MSEDFLSTFVGAPARARVLRVFIFNQSEALALSHVAQRAGVSTVVAEKEVHFLKRAGIIKEAKFSVKVGSGERRVVAGKQPEDAWAFDTQSQHAAALSKFIHEISPVEHKEVVVTLRRSGSLGTIVLSGTFVGDMSRPVDLLVVANGLNEDRLERAVKALERLYGREVRYASFTTPEFRYRLTIQDRLLRDTLDYPHLVLLDKGRLL